MRALKSSVMIVNARRVASGLAVYLRQRWSPESKPIHALHGELVADLRRGALVAKTSES